jgi:hypothetical protein
MDVGYVKLGGGGGGGRALGLLLIENYLSERF